MSDYDDKSYYEIQLEQKQLVLILLLMVAVCVLFFFLGVYYVKGREPVSASGRPTPAPTKTALEAPPGPDKVETGDVSRFFENGGSKEGAPKQDFEGKVIAESKAVDPVPATKTPAAPKTATPPPAEKTPKPTPVATKEPTPVAPPSPAETKPPAAGSGSFVVQIAALKDVDQANKVKADLKSKGFPAFVDTVDKAGETFYKVRVGPFSEKGKATEAMDGLKSQGYGQAFVSPN